MKDDTKKVFHCPQCGKRLSIDTGKDFTRGRCPSCRSRIAIPKPENK